MTRKIRCRPERNRPSTWSFPRVIFTSYWYTLFAVVFFAAYWAAPWRLPRLGLLVAGSFWFYLHFAGAAGILPIVVLAATTYLGGLLPWRGARVVAMALPIASLVFYKYTHFLAEQVVGLVSADWAVRSDALAGHWLPAAAPLAVSFFVFEFVHYLYDVNQGSAPIRNPAKFAAFAFFFPSLVAGPIKRYQPFLGSLNEGLGRVSLEDVKVGLVRVAIGLFKKVALADNLAAAIRYWEPQYEHLSRHSRWEFLAVLALRILLDFSGYSDIAIGFARMMGIAIPENFNWPYLAGNVRDFWHRWHISLSTWIRDYVYIPLGGNRHGTGRKILNGFIAFGLVGLWHGPSWHYAFWGLYHGAGLAVSANYPTLFGSPGRALARCFERVPVLGWALTLLFVLIGWLYFFYPMADANRMVELLVIKKP